MSDKINENGFNNIPSIKDLIKVGEIKGINVDNLLNGLSQNSNKTIENKQNELAGCFEMAEFIYHLDKQQTEGVNTIFAQFLTPQNSIA